MNFQIKPLTDLGIPAATLAVLGVTHGVYQATPSTIDPTPHKRMVALCASQDDAQRVARALELFNAIGRDEMRVAVQADDEWRALTRAGTLAAIEELHDDVDDSQVDAGQEITA